jgi:hypothetical protein
MLWSIIGYISFGEYSKSGAMDPLVQCRVGELMTQVHNWVEGENESATVLIGLIRGMVVSKTDDEAKKYLEEQLAGLLKKINKGGPNVVFPQQHLVNCMIANIPLAGVGKREQWVAKILDEYSQEITGGIGVTTNVNKGVAEGFKLTQRLADASMFYESPERRPQLQKRGDGDVLRLLQLERTKWIWRLARGQSNGNLPTGKEDYFAWLAPGSDQFVTVRGENGKQESYRLLWTGNQRNYKPELVKMNGDLSVIAMLDEELRRNVADALTLISNTPSLLEKIEKYRKEIDENRGESGLDAPTLAEQLWNFINPERAGGRSMDGVISWLATPSPHFARWYRYAKGHDPIRWCRAMMNEAQMEAKLYGRECKDVMKKLLDSTWDTAGYWNDEAHTRNIGENNITEWMEYIRKEVNIDRTIFDAFADITRDRTERDKQGGLQLLRKFEAALCEDEHSPYYKWRFGRGLNGEQGRQAVRLTFEWLIKRGLLRKAAVNVMAEDVTLAKKLQELVSNKHKKSFNRMTRSIEALEVLTNPSADHWQNIDPEVMDELVECQMGAEIARERGTRWWDIRCKIDEATAHQTQSRQRKAMGDGKAPETGNAELTTEEERNVEYGRYKEIIKRLINGFEADDRCENWKGMEERRMKTLRAATLRALRSNDLLKIIMDEKKREKETKYGNILKSLYYAAADVGGTQWLWREIREKPENRLLQWVHETNPDDVDAAFMAIAKEVYMIDGMPEDMAERRAMELVDNEADRVTRGRASTIDAMWMAEKLRSELGLASVLIQALEKANDGEHQGERGYLTTVMEMIFADDEEKAAEQYTKLGGSYGRARNSIDTDAIGLSYMAIVSKLRATCWKLDLNEETHLLWSSKWREPYKLWQEGKWIIGPREANMDAAKIANQAKHACSTEMWTYLCEGDHLLAEKSPIPNVWPLGAVDTKTSIRKDDIYDEELMALWRNRDEENPLAGVKVTNLLQRLKDSQLSVAEMMWMILKAEGNTRGRGRKREWENIAERLLWIDSDSE